MSSQRCRARRENFNAKKRSLRRRNKIVKQCHVTQSREARKESHISAYAASLRETTQVLSFLARMAIATR
jgi:hypothetical protein